MELEGCLALFIRSFVCNTKRPSVKQSIKQCVQILSFRVNLTQVETVIDGRSHIYVFSESPFEMVTITFKYTASHLQVYPPFEIVICGR